MDKGSCMESKVPGCKPGIFPFIGHGNNVPAGEVLPVIVTFLVTVRLMLIGLSKQPFKYIQVIELFGPQQTTYCTTEQCLACREQVFRRKLIVVRICFCLTFGKYFVKVSPRVIQWVFA